MSGFAAFFAKELHEIVRTWKVWVLPGVLLFTAITSPILAQLTPTLVKSLTTAQPGVVIRLPEPTALDAYAQWVKNLSQIVLTVAVAMAAASVASERGAGTTVLVLTKPVSRAGFVVAKYLAHVVLLVLATTVGALICYALTVALFGEAEFGFIAKATGAWLVYALTLSAVGVLLSTFLNTVAAVVVSVFVSPVFSVLALWRQTRDYSPAGLVSAMNELGLGKEPEVLWPVITSGVVAVIAIAVAVLVFRTREP